MKALLDQLIPGKRVLILGFGKEGQSTFRLLKEYYPDQELYIADRNPEVSNHDLLSKHPSDTCNFGPHYLEGLDKFDLIIKSPGIKMPEGFNLRNPCVKVSSQTDLILQYYHTQVIGVTGTKGKSTTSSLIRHILSTAGTDSILVGNIGSPPFDHIHLINGNTKIVYELSSNQLEDISRGPHIAVILNLYQEHLDRYPSVKEYFTAKFNILKGQTKQDIIIYNTDNVALCEYFSTQKSPAVKLIFSASEPEKTGFHLRANKIYSFDGSKSSFYMEAGNELFLKGDHNRMNIMAAILAVQSIGVNDEFIRQGVRSFQGLEHRMEFVGEYRHIRFYNDSIATIPEATLEAVKALKDVDTLILGGFDRMLDYGKLVEILSKSSVRNLIFMGQAGQRMYSEFLKNNLVEKNLILVETLEKAFQPVLELTRPGCICLLSPAAASYDSFKNFEERGKLFKKIAASL